ncbi:archaeal proteasome endopeptidase complex subunit alpha [Candidatus Woesearchaeota archaeon]|jgi:proteasome alpha subunit|nr:archaeal proteasome endopeptidase complex subunit alpha [Candidatus Woesearchaeota archaeon]MBT5215934.1 archaeal proteasome endopeptidase complex subunit alpha [Candidatus Woesearchaeota archaeon]MBT6402353.1 archaeal proteasome endopeptidase complex subunit alpha [Candidatus Woesearchaeota archaeon]
MQADESSHQAMGYDRASTVFSPDGRLLQVEYARKTIKAGSTAVGITCKEGVLILADKRVVEKLIVGKSVEKIFQIDEHIGASVSGISSDGRILIEKAQVAAQQHRVTCSSPISTESLVKDICNTKQMYTQVGGARPFGVSLMFMGVGDSSHIFVTDPTGTFFEYKATAIGEMDDEVKEILNKEYKENMTLDQALKLAMTSLKKTLGDNFNIGRIDGSYISSKDKTLKKFTSEELTKATK